MRRWILPSFLPLLAILLLGILPGAALAHEGELVAGKYEVVVGFLNEPAIADQMNGLDLRVFIPAENNKPVVGLEQSLKATVSVGGGARSMPLNLEARHGAPGSYMAQFIPTRAGSYIFQISGTIEGVPVDERFESGPGRFSDVQTAQPLQFPDSLPGGLAAANEVRAAREEASLARLLGLGGLLFGVAGLIVATLALRGRRGSSAHEADAQAATDPSSRAA